MLWWTRHAIQSTNLLPFVSDKHCQGGQWSWLSGWVLGTGWRWYWDCAQTSPFLFILRHKIVRVLKGHNWTVQKEVTGKIDNFLFRLYCFQRLHTHTHLKLMVNGVFDDWCARAYDCIVNINSRFYKTTSDKQSCYFWKDCILAHTHTHTLTYTWDRMNFVWSPPVNNYETMIRQSARRFIYLVFVR